MTLIMDLFHSASNGILSILEHPITLIAFITFLAWVSVKDLKTMTVRNHQNLLFMIVGFLFFMSTTMNIWDFGLNQGLGHLYGAITGFLLLFIPGMILNYAFGGDIKFAAVMGFWIGPAAILLIMIMASLIQILILLSKSLITKNFSMKNNFPFAPAFTAAYLISLTILLLI